MGRVVQGAVFHRLTVIGRANATRKWTCRCSCGAEKDIHDSNIGTRTTSCGCAGTEARKARATHGGCSGGKTPEYMAWARIKTRCWNDKSIGWENYGGRGISMCEEWRNSFPAFLAHVGKRPTRLHSVERIDNNRGYEPGNVKWATREEQNRNRRNSKRIAAFGETLSPAEWSSRFGIPPHVIRRRLSSGWGHEDAVWSPRKYCGRRAVAGNIGNPRWNTMVTALGKTAPAPAWAAETGIPLSTIVGRIKCGWSHHDAVTTTPRKRKISQPKPRPKKPTTKRPTRPRPT